MGGASAVDPILLVLIVAVGMLAVAVPLAGLLGYVVGRRSTSTSTSASPAPEPEPPEDDFRWRRRPCGGDPMATD